MEIILALIGVGVLALLARRNKAESMVPPITDGEKSEAGKAENATPESKPDSGYVAEVPPDQAEHIKAENARELAAIEEIESMIGEKSKVVMDTVFIRADGNGPGSVSNPATTPSKGVYYRVQTGDNPIALMRKVGYPDSYWRKLAAANRWCEKRDSSGTLVGMNFYSRWDPPGFNTVLRPANDPSLVYPIIYIPRAEEMAAL